MNLAAVDIGSNAVRFLIMEISEADNTVNFKKRTLIRVPIRLGEDVFTKGRVETEKLEKLTQSLIAFRMLAKVYEVEKMRICATSALREASNGNEIVSSLKKNHNIKVELIDGKVEADIIHSNAYESNIIKKDVTYLFVDVGGGSTELSLMKDGKTINSISLKLGTVRILKKKDKKEDWKKLKSWVEEVTNEHNVKSILGSGGNINKLQKISRSSKQDFNLSKQKLASLYNNLAPLSVKERITTYNLNPDRADVIVHAAKLFMKICEYSGCENIIVPKIGLSDGMIKVMYRNFKQKEN